jgi:ribosomal protein L11 methyltransferase
VEWLEFSVTADTETAEPVIELFNRYGHGGAVVETPVDCLEDELALAAPPSLVIVRAYLPLDLANAPEQAEDSGKSPHQRLEEGLWHLSMIRPLASVEIRRLAEEDWANAWKKQYHILRIGHRTRIVPAWEEYEPQSGEVVVRLEPGMAFGTGLHPTTRLCLQALETFVTPGCAVLDVGTGSGVLAIAAAKLGARSVLALDTDPVAVTVAGENAARNAVADLVTVRHGSLAGGTRPWLVTGPATGGNLSLLDTGRFDLVVANILAPVIVGMAAGLAARAAERGHVIVSGLIASQETEVAAALLGQGLRLVHSAHEFDWVALVTRRDPELCGDRAGGLLPESASGE